MIKKLLLTFIVLILINSFVNAEEWKKPDSNFNDYYLSGEFKKDKDFSYIYDEFVIHDGKIFIISHGDMEGIFGEKISDGEYELTTWYNTKLKFNVRNGEIFDLYLKNFENTLNKDELNIKSNYCKKAFFYSLYNRAYNKNIEKRFFMRFSGKINGEILPGNTLEFFNYNGKILISSLYDNSDIYEFSSGEIYFILNSNKSNEKILLITTDEKENNLIIKNCYVKYYDSMLPLNKF